MAPKVFVGLICCYEACDPDDCVMGLKGKQQCLCFTKECCCAFDEENVGVGLVTNEDNGECCKLGCYCYSFGCKKPDKCFASASQFLCIRAVGSFPPDARYLDSKDYLLAYYCLQCFPQIGCCMDAPACPSLDNNVSINDYTQVAVVESMEMTDRFSEDSFSKKGTIS